MPRMMIDAEEIQSFWFYEIGPDRWFSKDPELGKLIRERYEKAYERAALDECRDLEETPEGMLTLMLLLDQFPRHMYRGTAKAYETDDFALELARQAIINHFDDRIDIQFKLFFYLPFAHSESMGDQRLSVFYIRERTKDPNWVDSAEWRLSTIEKFGRFPHRNAVLDRQTTPEEEAFLKENETTA